jgi:hypothetical protein
MDLKTIKQNLIRRMSVNYLAYMGQVDIDAEWLEGYFQAKKDADAFLSQLQIYEPYNDETT